MKSLRDALVKYVAVRRAFGTQLREPAVALGQFVALLEQEGAEFITTDLALRWAMNGVVMSVSVGGVIDSLSGMTIQSTPPSAHNL